MARRALVLAGAQVGGAGDGEDGNLQSAEIVDRNWEGTELVVLGACETALRLEEPVGPVRSRACLSIAEPSLAPRI